MFDNPQAAMQSLSDEVLVRQLTNGDRDAFWELFEKYHHRLYRHVLKFAKSPELAEDVVQDTFLKIWENRQNLNPEMSFAGYLQALSRNQVLNLLKRTAVERRIKKEFVFKVENVSNTTENSLADHEYEALISQAIEQLPPQRQAIFRLCRQEGKTYQETAEMLGISKNTVKEHMVLAMKAIRNFFSLHTGLTLFWAFFSCFPL